MIEPLLMALLADVVFTLVRALAFRSLSWWRQFDGAPPYGLVGIAGQFAGSVRHSDRATGPDGWQLSECDHLSLAINDGAGMADAVCGTARSSARPRE